MTCADRGMPRMMVWILLAASAACFFYPAFFDTLSGIRQTTELSGYEDTVHLLDDREKRKALKQAEAYNEHIAAEQERMAFGYRGELATDADYEAALNQNRDGIMGELVIPEIGVALPVSHGTRETDLEYRCGHMYGTSLPVGGMNTHAVLAGHTGLPTASLFTHLTDLKEGDVFYIRILGETHVYEVESTRVVWPEEEMAYLQIEKGQDLVTLYTCTPYGINDRRLLVKGARRYPDLTNQEGSGGKLLVRGDSVRMGIRAVLLALVSPLILATGLIRWIRRRRA